MLGTPLEYFNPLNRSALSERWRCGPGFDAYLAALHARRTTDAGLFAAKVHWEQMVQIRLEAGAGTSDRFAYETPASLLERLFPTPLFIRLVRSDLDRQAVSLWRAYSSNVVVGRNE